MRRYSLLAVTGFAIYAMSAGASDLALQAPNGTLTPEANKAMTEATEQRLASGEAGDRAGYIIQFTEPVDDAVSAQLTGLGAEVIGYYPQNAFLVRASGDCIRSIQQSMPERWLVEYRGLLKISPQLDRQIAERNATQPIRISAQLWPGESPAEFAIRAEALGASDTTILISSPDTPRVLVEFAPGTVTAECRSKLIDDTSVQWLSTAPVGTRRNNTTRWVVQSNSLNVTPFYGEGLHGEGQIVGHIDGEISQTSCYFSDPESDPVGSSHRKLQAYYEASGAEGHGTHTAGTIAGFRADSNIDGAGIAYRARLAHGLDLDVYGTGPSPITLEAALQRAQADGAFIHSNSWGDDSTTDYNDWCRDIDKYSYENEDALVIFAATNLSNLKNPENAKNVLAVGASQQSPNQHVRYSGGEGPTADGRRKPEIFAPGDPINSADSGSSCGLQSAGGTSMACPAIAGTAALIRQYYMEGFYPTGTAQAVDAFTPTGALLKATILNAGVDMTGIADYPNNKEGWGRILAENSIYFDGDPRTSWIRDIRHASGVTNGGLATYNITVTGTSQPFAVTLVWTDPAGVSGSVAPVVNNLNLEVVGPGPITYRGNVFSGVGSVTGGTADPLNNVEQVRLTSVASGTWTIRVLGTSVPVGPQGYALVASGNLQMEPSTSVEGWKSY